MIIFLLFAPVVVDTGWPPVSLIPVANLPSILSTPAVQVAIFANGVIDIGCKFATGVADTRAFYTGGALRLGNISASVKKKFEMTLKLFSWAWEKLIHKKACSKGLVTLSL